MPFADRTEAGRLLAERLAAMDLPDPIVLALPRGGVPIGTEVARMLGCPLDVLVARKIGAPGNPEFGLGAVTPDDPPSYTQQYLDRLGLTEDDLEPLAERERAEARRRAARYREGRPPLDLSGRTVIVVDDGVATGGTARAALRSVRRHAARLVFAVPVCAADSDRLLREEADDFVCLHAPRELMAVGFWYDDFAQLTDEDVIKHLRTTSPP